MMIIDGLFETGVCGVVLSKLEPSRVVLTDRDEDVMVLAQHNMRINNCPGKKNTSITATMKKKSQGLNLQKKSVARIDMSHISKL